MNKSAKSLLVILTLFCNDLFASWAIHNETKLPTVISYQGSGYSHATIFSPPNGPSQIYIWVRPTGVDYCRAQGEPNGDFGYVVPTSILVNNTLIYVKKFIEPTEKGCYVYFAGKSPEDKKVLVSEFMKSNDVFIEIDGVDKGFASKYRGELVKISDIKDVDGNPFSYQLVNDTFGAQHQFLTVPITKVRWYRFKTDNFKTFWKPKQR